MKKFIGLGLRLLLLTVLLFIIFSVASIIAGLSDSTQPADPLGAAGSLLAVSALFSMVLSYPIIRSRWAGWPLILTVFTVMFGIMTFLSQIETVVFLNYLVDIVSPEMIPRLFLQGFVIAVLFSPLAVLVHGKWKRDELRVVQESTLRLAMPPSQWIWKLLLIAVIYIVIYIGFGTFVFAPLAGDAFQEFYVGLEMPPWILPFQAGRALIWTAIAVLVIRMMKGPWWESGLAVSLLFSVLMGALLLLPNQFMPDKIRLAHFVEVTLSNVLFGWIVVWVLLAEERRISAVEREGN